MLGYKCEPSCLTYPSFLNLTFLVCDKVEMPEPFSTNVGDCGIFEGTSELPVRVRSDSLTGRLRQHFLCCACVRAGRFCSSFLYSEGLHLILQILKSIAERVCGESHTPVQYLESLLHVPCNAVPTACKLSASEICRRATRSQTGNPAAPPPGLLILIK